MSGRETGIAIVGLIAGTVIGAFTWSSIGPKDTMIDNSEENANPAGAASSVDLQAENDRLKAEMASMRDEANRKNLAEAEKAPTPKEKEAVAKEAAALIGVTFKDEKFQDALASIDWDTVGSSMKDMIPLMARLAEAIENGEDPDLAMVGEIQQLNGELMKAAQKIMEGNIPGTGVNGSFTHPVVVANQIGAALKAAGVELSAEQKASLERAMRFYSAKDESLRLAEDSKDFKLEVLNEEAEFKAAFYDEARGMLTKEQRSALFSDRSSGRMGFDLFDSSLMLGGYALPLQVKDATELASKLSGRFAKTKIDEAGRKKLNAIITKWSNELPADFWSTKGNALDRSGAMSSSAIRAALKRQTALYREIFANVNLSAEERSELQKSLRIMVPIPR